MAAKNVKMLPLEPVFGLFFPGYSRNMGVQHGRLAVYQTSSICGFILVRLRMVNHTVVIYGNLCIKNKNRTLLLFSVLYFDSGNIWKHIRLVLCLFWF